MAANPAPCSHTTDDECRCPCHRHVSVIHVVPCCRPCPRCRRKVKLPPAADKRDR